MHPHDDPDEPVLDGMHPPEIPTLVGCLHCGEEYDSYLIEWRVTTDADGMRRGFWSCPTPGCGGIGFGCDILPVDPDYQDERGGWCTFDDDDEDEDGDILGRWDDGVCDENDTAELEPPGGESELPF